MTLAPFALADLPAYLAARDAWDARLRDEARPHVLRTEQAMQAQAAAPLGFPEAKRMWEAKMLDPGARHARETVEAAALREAGGGDENTFGLYYYDRARIFYAIADRIRDRSAGSQWMAAAQAAVDLYRDDFLAPGNYASPGFWSFPHGLAEHFRRTGDVRSRAAVLGLATNAAFAQDIGSGGVLAEPGLVRENAYSLMSHLCAESLGAPRREATAWRVEDAFAHYDQWCVSRTERQQPFMTALWAEALIQFDATLPPTHGLRGRIHHAIRSAYDQMWETYWRPESGSFAYIYADREEPSPDLSLLICPPFGWLLARSDGVETRHRDRGDLAFAGGVLHAWMDPAKQWNQCYRWSGDYIAWRGRSWVETYPPSEGEKKYRTDVLPDMKTLTYPLPDRSDA